MKKQQKFAIKHSLQYDCHVNKLNVMYLLFESSFVQALTYFHDHHVSNDRKSHLCVLQQALLDALLELSSSLRVAAHGDDDLHCVAVVQVSRHREGAGVVHQNHFDFIRAVRLLHSLLLTVERHSLCLTATASVITSV